MTDPKTTNDTAALLAACKHADEMAGDHCPYHLGYKCDGRNGQCLRSPIDCWPDYFRSIAKDET